MKYYMDCNNEECGWTGIVDYDKTLTCPECGGSIEPSQIEPSNGWRPIPDQEK